MTVVDLKYFVYNGSCNLDLRMWIRDRVYVNGVERAFLECVRN